VDVHAAREFVESHGVVLVAARGPVPRMTEVIAGEPITGSWWGHAKGHEIYAVLGELESWPELVVCRAVAGKVTLAHRRVWPALIRVADRIGHERLARVEQEHTTAGHHVNHETPFPQWADAASLRLAPLLSEDEAVTILGDWVPTRRP
jgi:hypothetical protein